MYDLHLSAEQIEMRDTVRDFVDKEIKPAALHPGRLEPFAKPLLADLLGKASQMGLRTLALAEDAGGAGADCMTSCIVMEELAAGEVDIAVALGHTAALAPFVFGRMSAAQRAFFREICRGRRVSCRVRRPRSTRRTRLELPSSARCRRRAGTLRGKAR